MPELAYFLKADLSKGFTLSRVVEKNDGSLWEGKHIYTAKKEYLEFFKNFFTLMYRNTKKTTRLAFINADKVIFKISPPLM